MTDTAALQAQLDALKAAYWTGATSIAYEGKTITYRDAADMRAAIASLESELGLTRKPTVVVVRSSKGW